MHRNLSHLLPLCFLVAACGSSARHQSLVERRDAIRASNAAHEEEFFENYRSRDGFQDTRWGMSPEEVKALYPGSSMVNTQGDVRAKTQVADRPATVDFFFTQSKLAVLTVTFDTSDPLREEFGSLADVLALKYGQPTTDVDTAEAAEDRLYQHEQDNRRMERIARMRELGEERRSGKLTEDPVDPVDPQSRRWEEESRLDALNARNDYSLKKIWRNGETELLLSGRQTPARSTLTLQYESRHLRQSLARELETDRERGKQRQADEL